MSRKNLHGLVFCTSFLRHKQLRLLDYLLLNWLWLSQTLPKSMLPLSISRHIRAWWEMGRPERPQYFVHIFYVLIFLHIFALLFTHSSTYSQPERVVMSYFPGWSTTHTYLQFASKACNPGVHHLLTELNILDWELFSCCCLQFKYSLKSFTYKYNWPTNYLLFSPLLESLDSKFPFSSLLLIFLGYHGFTCRS